MSMNIQGSSLTYRKIFIFWYPLLLSWLMMGFENPFVAAVIARLPEPKYNLAAFGVAFYLALLLEAPIIMLLSAATALCRDRDAYRKLWRFTVFLNIVITVLLVIIVIPPVFRFVGESMIGLPPKVSGLTHKALIFLLPWPAAIGFRRFYQGIMVRFDLTRRVAYGTVVRLVFMAGTALLLYWFGVSGAYAGAGALSAGVCFEAVATYFMVKSSLVRVRGIEPEGGVELLTYRSIWKFYSPLAVMMILSLGVHPMVTFFMGRSRFALESLAVLPVLNALSFLFRSPGLSYTEVVIALMGKGGEGYVRLRNFVFFLCVVVTVVMVVVAFTPLSVVWFSGISGLSEELARFSFLPLKLMVLLPAATALMSFQRGVLVGVGKTGPISGATIIEVGVIVVFMVIGVFYFDMVGVTAAACAYVLGRFGTNLYLLPSQARAVRSFV